VFFKRIVACKHQFPSGSLDSGLSNGAKLFRPKIPYISTKRHPIGNDDPLRDNKGHDEPAKVPNLPREMKK
jgi:hypothetical protein